MKRLVWWKIYIDKAEKTYYWLCCKLIRDSVDEKLEAMKKSCLRYERAIKHGRFNEIMSARCGARLSMQLNEKRRGPYYLESHLGFT